MFSRLGVGYAEQTDALRLQSHRIALVNGLWLRLNAVLGGPVVALGLPLCEILVVAQSTLHNFHINLFPVHLLVQVERKLSYVERCCRGKLTVEQISSVLNPN